MTSNKPDTALLDETGSLATELLRRLDLLAGGRVHEDTSISQYKVLSAIRSHDGISIGNLGRAVGSAQSTASETVAHLEKAGLVEKHVRAYDRRSVIVELTEVGRQVVQRRRGHIREGHRKLLDAMPPADREVFLTTLPQLVNLLERGMENMPSPKPERARTALPASRVADRTPRLGAAAGPSAARIFTVKQIAKMCRVSRQKVRNWVSRLGLPTNKTIGGQPFKITEKDLKEFSERLRVHVDWDLAEEDQG